jgi:endo-1,4-beta-xylanase
MATSAGALYFDATAPRQGEYNLENFREVSRFATAAFLPLRAHPIVWHEHMPAWLQSLSAAETSDALQRHVLAVMRAAPGIVRQWDVLNEPIAPASEAGPLRDSFWRARLGEDYPLHVLRWARGANQTAELGINEFGIEDDSRQADVKRARTLRLLDRLASQSAPLDYLGIQGHLSTERRTDKQRLKSFLADVRSFGLRVHITELDVNDRDRSADTNSRDAAVADAYESFLEAVAESGCVDTVTTWGLTDPLSWLQQSSRRPDSRPLRPLLFDENFEPKQSWRVFRQFVRIKNAHLAPA